MAFTAYTSSSLRSLARTGILKVVFMRKDHPRRKRPEAGPDWKGSSFRYMICTLCPSILFSPSGLIGLGFRKKGKDNRRKFSSKSVNSNIIIVWDLLWQNWRAISTDRILDVDYAKIPPSFEDKDIKKLITQVKTSHPEYTYNLYDTPTELFFNVFSYTFKDLGPKQKYAIMDERGKLPKSICKLYETALVNYKKQLEQILKGTKVKPVVQKGVSIKGQQFEVDNNGYLVGDTTTWTPEQTQALIKAGFGFGQQSNEFEAEDTMNQYSDSQIASLFDAFIKIDANNYLKNINGKIKVL